MKRYTTYILIALAVLVLLGLAVPWFAVKLAVAVNDMMGGM